MLRPSTCCMMLHARYVCFNMGVVANGGSRGLWFCSALLRGFVVGALMVGIQQFR